jgi:hypothetical protein
MSSALARRLENSALEWISTLPAPLAELVQRVRDVDAPLTPAGAPPEPILIAVAKEMGRISVTVIRNLELRLSIRTNKNTVRAATFDTLLGALEVALDSTNLVDALTDDVTLKVHVFVAVRRSGTVVTLSGQIREEGYVLDVKAVLTELTTGG